MYCQRVRASSYCRKTPVDWPSMSVHVATATWETQVEEFSVYGSNIYHRRLPILECWSRIKDNSRQSIYAVAVSSSTRRIRFVCSRICETCDFLKRQSLIHALPRTITNSIWSCRSWNLLQGARQCLDLDMACLHQLWKEGESEPMSHQSPHCAKQKHCSNLNYWYSFLSRCIHVLGRLGL
jgi:hypothetical protein